MTKKSKTVKQHESVSVSKRPKIVENPSSYWGTHPVWSFRSLDTSYHKWGLSQTTQLFEDVICKLKELEGMTWNSIMSASGGRTHGTNSHFENVAELIPEAQKRWIALHLEDYDRVFSLRLTGTYRLFGILEDGVFRIVWFDQNHEIYAVKK